jgi:hypothetical protein
MPDETPQVKPEPTPPAKQEQTPAIRDPAAIFIAAATLFAIFINAQNVGPILMLGVIALLLEIRLRPKD